MIAKTKRQAAMSRRRMISDEAAWKSVLARDRASDGKFVFAVSSTGIYCRPSCPARRPARKNVTFFKTPEDAEKAGYRSCRRCEPGSPAGTIAEQAVRAAMRFLDGHLDEPFTLDDLSRRIGFSKFHLQRLFKRNVGVSPRQYRDARRMERLKMSIRNGQPITHATYDSGFGSSRALYERADKHLGMSPQAYRHGGRGKRITFAIAASPMGRVLVAASERGVCAVSIGANDKELERQLRREFPNADISKSHDKRLSAWLAAILASLDGKCSSKAIPLDLTGTVFQMRVWHALLSIPPGETRTYTEIAREIGRPAAVRAVANACARNRVALLIPCHRVIRKNDQLGGYRWGLARKKNLLEREQARAHS